MFLPPNARSPGTAFTVECAKRLGKELLIVDPHAPDAARSIRDWLAAQKIRILNIGGPRESEAPSIYIAVLKILTALLQ